MKTENLIDQLSANLKPVKPISKTWLRMFYLVCLVFMTSGLVFLLFSIRHDLYASLSNIQFIAGAILMFASWIFSTYSLSLSQLPSQTNRNMLFLSLTLVLFLTGGYLIFGNFDSPQKIYQGLSNDGLHCSLSVFLLSALPIFGLFLILRKSAPINSIVTGLNIGLCCASFAIFLLQFSCSSDNFMHLFLWHQTIPLISILGIGAVVGGKVLKW